MIGRVCLAIALASVVAAPAAARPSEVVVGLFHYRPPAAMTVSAPTTWGVRSNTGGGAIPAGASLSLSASGHRVVARLGARVFASGPTLRLDSEAPWTLRPVGGQARRYRGALTVTAREGRLVPALALPLEAYVTAATGDEMLPHWPAAALEAQAIAARSYALANRDRHRAEGFDFCDSTHCQLFRGLAAEDARVRRAASATAGRYLVYGGRPAVALWHSTCGGERAGNASVFGGEALPYLKAGSDRDASGRAWCEASPHHPRWRVRYAPERLTKSLRAAGTLGPDEPLTGLTTPDRLADGTTMTVRLVGRRPRALSGYAFWMALGPQVGWGEVKSPAFRVVREGGHYLIEGTGLGHRVGMCQWGARGRALAGHSAEAILASYYPGTTLGLAPL